MLLSKKCDASKPENYHPVSLKNCSIKLLRNAFPLEPKPFINHLIHHEQIRFIRGRRIAENFVHAADIVQTCYMRKLPAIVIKIYFIKLLTLYLARPYPLLYAQRVSLWLGVFGLSSQTSLPALLCCLMACLDRGSSAAGV